jgi:hypothetical protein
MIRPSLILLPLAFSAAPALAQAAPAPAPQLAIDPATVNKLAEGMRAMSQALLDLHIGELQAAAEGRAATAAEKNLTLGDIARRDDPDFDRHLQQRIAEAKPQIEQSLKVLNETLPKVTEDLQRAQKSIERAMANMPDPNYPKR